MDFTLEQDDAKWVHEMIVKAYEELRQTTPNGRAFAETVQTILDRERNWVRWKNDLCNLFDKDSLSESLEDRAAPLLEKSRQPIAKYKHKLGSEALTEIWAMGYRDLYDLESRFSAGEVKDFVKEIEKENNRISFRKQQLAKQAQKVAEAKARATASALTATPPSASQNMESSPTASPAAPVASVVAPSPQRPALAASISLGAPLHPSLPAKPGTIQVPAATPKPTIIASSPAPAPTPAPPTPAITVRPIQVTDSIIMKAEENKHRLSWLALRTARDEHLRHFGKIGNGDVLALVQEIEKEVEAEQRGESAGPSNAGENGGGVGSDRGTTPTPAAKTEAVEPVLEGDSQEQAKTSAPAGPDAATGAMASAASRDADSEMNISDKTPSNGNPADVMQGDS